MLATVIVIVAGTGLCTFIGAADSSSSGMIALGVVITVAVLLLLWLLWFRYSDHSSKGLGIWLSIARNPRDDGLASQYRPRKVNEREEARITGTNQPITAEEAHDLQVNSANTWVPSKNREGKEKPAPPRK